MSPQEKFQKKADPDFKGGDVAVAPGAQDFLKKLGSKKTQKSAKLMKGMFSAIDTAAPGLGTFLSMIPGIESVLKPLAILLKPYEPFLKVIGGLLTIMFSSALKPIMAFLKPFIPLLMALAPIFQIIGKVIGLVVVFALLPLIMAIYAVGIAMAFLIDLFTFGAAGAVNRWNATMGTALAGAIASVPEVLAMQQGGFIPATTGGTIVRIGEGREGEHVVPESQMSEVADLLRDQNRLIRKQTEREDWNF